MAKSVKKGNKKSRSKQQSRRNKKRVDQYKAKIETINYILNDYFRTFGAKGLEYNNLLTDVEKILGNENEIFINHGSETKPARVSKNIIYAKKRRSARLRTTKLFNYLNEKPASYELVKDVYGFRKIDSEVIKSVKALSALKKLENDALPNYYSALDIITNSTVSMRFRKEFSNKLKGRKRDSDEYKENYEELGRQIKDYLLEMGKQAQGIMDKLNDESIFDQYMPTTLGDILRKKK